jgi:hypothetical protein
VKVESVRPLSIDDPIILLNPHQPTGAANNTTTTTTRLCVFLISSAADGSVNRMVRKVSQLLKKENDTNTKDKNYEYYYAVALLGHARCENSALQMGDVIFGAGRRFEKSLSCSSRFQCTGTTGRLETQVDLVDPIHEFDPWIMALLSLDPK